VDSACRKYLINGAIELLRPGAKWEWTGGVGFTRWDDERPKPTKEEVEETMEKIKEFEDSINTIWTKEQLEEIGVYTKAIEESSL
jgi:hypothetical protein